MDKTWVLVADSEKARLFEFEHCREPWTEVACFVNPEPTRVRPGERPPRVHDSLGPARHAIEAHTSERDKALAHFAGMLVSSLREGHDQRRFQSLVLAASPRFLGVLHKQMDKPLQQCISIELRRNLIGLDSEGIAAYLLDARDKARNKAS